MKTGVQRPRYTRYLYRKAWNWPPLARQDEKEHESSDDGVSRLDDSYSPRRHGCSVRSPTEKRGSTPCLRADGSGVKAEF